MVLLFFNFLFYRGLAWYTNFKSIYGQRRASQIHMQYGITFYLLLLLISNIVSY